MGDSHGSNASTNVPQARDVLPGRLRGNMAGGPDTSGSSAGVAQMEVAPMEPAGLAGEPLVGARAPSS